MTPKTQDENHYKKLDKIAKNLGLQGSNGHYITDCGIEVDATGCAEDRLALGYRVAMSAGLIKFNK